jgi:RHS repeat-associated protein
MGGAYEVTGSTIRKYYSFAGMMVAMRDSAGLKFLLTDHLGSIVAITDVSGSLISEQRYLPFGQVREDVGTITATDFGYTGQRSLPEMGLMDYRARFYDPLLMRFIQADSIVPNPANPQTFNRYSYVGNSPINFSDPTGHDPCEGDYGYHCQIQRKHLGIQISEQLARNGGSSGDDTVGSIKLTDIINLSGSSTTLGGLSLYGLTSTTGSTPFSSVTGGAGGVGGGGFNILAVLATMEDLANWSLTTPGEMTIFQTAGYPLFSGTRLFYQPIANSDNGQLITIGPTSIGVGSMTLGFNGDFRYKQGLNSINALGIYAPGFQPWALKVSMDTTIPMGGSFSFTHRIGYEFTARPDNLSLVAAAVGIPALVVKGMMLLGPVGGGLVLRRVLETR